MSQQDASETRVPEFVGIVLACYIFSSLVTFARFYSRAIILKAWGVDDTIISIAWVFQSIFLSTNMLYIRFGAGRHEGLQSLEDKKSMAELAFFSRVIYQTALTLMKISICACYLRIFRQSKQKYFIYGIIALTILTWIPLALFDIFTCKPVSAAWTTLMMDGCKPFAPSFNANAILSVATDCMMLIFVMFHIYNLKMRLADKIGLGFLASLSVLSIAAAITRAVLVSRIRPNRDFSWDVSRIETCSFTEIAVGLFCASAIGIKPVLRKMKLVGPSENYLSTHSPSHHIVSPWINETNMALRRLKSQSLADLANTSGTRSWASDHTRSKSIDDVDLEDTELWEVSGSMRKYRSRCTLTVMSPENHDPEKSADVKEFDAK